MNSSHHKAVSTFSLYRHNLTRSKYKNRRRHRRRNHEIRFLIRLLKHEKRAPPQLVPRPPACGDPWPGPCCGALSLYCRGAATEAPPCGPEPPCVQVWAVSPSPRSICHTAAMLTIWSLHGTVLPEAPSNS